MEWHPGQVSFDGEGQKEGKKEEKRFTAQGLVYDDRARSRRRQVELKDTPYLQ